MVTITLYPTYTVYQEDSICDGDSLLFQGSYFSTAGTHQVIYPTINGCDSIYELNLNLIEAPEIVTIAENDISDCLSPDGSINIQATGGSGRPKRLPR